MNALPIVDEPKLTSAETFIADDAYACALKADQVLRRLEEEYRDRSGYKIHVKPGDAFLLRAAGYDPDCTRELDGEFARIQNERRHRAEAGTDERLQATQAELDAAIVEEKSAAPALEEEIAKMQARLRELRMAREAPAARLEVMMQARKTLLSACLPRFIQQELAWRKQLAHSNPPNRAQLEQTAEEIKQSFLFAACNSDLDDEEWLEQISW